MTNDQVDRICEALHREFTSPNVPDSNFDAANIVDVIANVANGLFRIAKEIEKLSGNAERGG
jgi:hypothetical protein